MKAKEVVAFAVLSILAHIGTFLREFPMGYDPYFYLTPGLAEAAGYPPLFSFVQDSLFAAPWITAIVFTFIFVILTYKIAERIGAKRPWLSAVLLFTAPMFIFRTALIEDDLLGFTVALLFVLIYLRQEGNTIHQWLSKTIAFLGSIACYFGVWRGLAFYCLSFLIAQGATHDKRVRYLIPIIAVLLAISAFLLAKPVTGEGTLGLFYFIPGLGILALGSLHPLLKKPHKHKLFMTLTYFFVGIALAQARFIWLCAPFVAILVSEHWGNWLFKKELHIAVLSVAIVIGLAFGTIGIWVEQPSAQMISDIHEVVELTNGSAIANEWQYGHWLNWAGADPMYTNLHPRVLKIPNNASFVLASHQTNVTSYPLVLVQNFSQFALFQVQS